MKNLKTIAMTLSLAAFTYCGIGVATTTTDLVTVQADTWKKFKNQQKRTWNSMGRSIERDMNRGIRNTQRAAIVGTVGIASGGILLKPSDRRQFERMRKQYGIQQPVQIQPQQSNQIIYYNYNGVPYSQRAPQPHHYLR